MKMCNCVTDLEAKVKSHLSEKKAYRKPITKVEMKGRGFVLGDAVSMRTKTDFEVTLEGQKKKVNIPVFHSFCPFCGEKVETA